MFQDLLVDESLDANMDWEAGPGFAYTEIRLFLPLQIGPLLVSIQASKEHSCRPMVTLDDPMLYKSFEVAMIEIVGDAEVPVNPLHDKRFQKFGWAQRWEHCRFGLGPEAGIFMPADEVQQMCDDLSKRTRRSPKLAHAGCLVVFAQAAGVV